MPRTDVVFYQEDESDVPVLDWLKEIRRTDQRAYATCVAAIERLADFGHELRRPLADFLRGRHLRVAGTEGPSELPDSLFLPRRGLAILGHALTKEDRVPSADMERALRRKKAFEANPVKHSYSEEEEA